MDVLSKLEGRQLVLTMTDTPDADKLDRALVGTVVRVSTQSTLVDNSQAEHQLSWALLVELDPSNVEWSDVGSVYVLPKHPRQGALSRWSGGVHVYIARVGPGNIDQRFSANDIVGMAELRLK